MPLCLRHELIAGIEQTLVVAGSIEVEMEVATVDGSPRLRVRRQCVDPHVAGPVGLCACHNREIAHVSLHLVVMLQVAVDVEVRAAADSEHAVGDTQSPQVGLVEIHHDGTAQTLLAHQRIDASSTLHQVVVAGHVGIAATVAHAGIGLHACKVIAGIAELLDVGLRREGSARRHQVGALSLQVDGARERTQPVVGQEVLQGQSVGGELRLIGLATHIVAHVAAQRPVAFLCLEAGGIFLAVGLHVALQGKIARYVHVFLQVLRQEFLQEAGIAGVGIDVDISLQAIGVVEVLQRACGLQAEGSGQRNVQIAHAHILHVASHDAIYLQLLVRPLLAEACRHVFHESHQVLLAQRGMYRALQRAGIQVGECIERHIEVAAYRRLRSLDTAVLQAHPSGSLHAVAVVAGMHSKLSRHILHVEAALLLESKFLQIGCELWLARSGFVAIADVLGMQRQVFHVKVVGVGLAAVVVFLRAPCLRLALSIKLIVGQRTLLDVHRADFVVAVLQIERAVADGGITQTGGDKGGRRLLACLRIDLAGHLQPHIRILYLGLLRHDAPRGFALCRILGHAIGQHNVEVGILQQHVVEVHIAHTGVVLPFQQDVGVLHTQLAHTTFHSCRLDEIAGVQLRILQRELVHHHLLLQQRLQLHIGHDATHMGQRVGRCSAHAIALYHTHLVHLQVEWEPQPHVAHLHIHSRFFRRIRRSLLHCPTLERREVKQSCH